VPTYSDYQRTERPNGASVDAAHPNGPDLSARKTRAASLFAFTSKQRARADHYRTRPLSRNSAETYLASFVLRSPKVFFAESDSGRPVLAEKNTEYRCCESLSLIFITLIGESQTRDKQRERKRGEREREILIDLDFYETIIRNEYHYPREIFISASTRLPVYLFFKEIVLCTIEDQAKVNRIVPYLGYGL